MTTGPIAQEPKTRELQPWHTTALDIAGCHRFEIEIPIYGEFEKAGLMFETWPEPVRALVLRHMREWRERNPARDIRAVTYGTFADSEGVTCATIVHHAAKGSAAARLAPPSEAAGRHAQAGSAAPGSVAPGAASFLPDANGASPTRVCSSCGA